MYDSDERESAIEKNDLRLRKSPHKCLSANKEEVWGLPIQSVLNMILLVDNIEKQIRIINIQ